MWDREILYTYVTNFLKNKLLFIKNKEKNYTWFQNIRLYNVRVPSLSNHSFFTWLSNHSYSDKEEIQKTRKLLGQHQSVQRKGHCHLCGRKDKGKLFLCSHKKRVLKESSRMKEQYSTSPVQKKKTRPPTYWGNPWTIKVEKRVSFSWLRIFFLIRRDYSG
jgi:hypothetical protein